MAFPVGNRTGNLETQSLLSSSTTSYGASSTTQVTPQDPITLARLMQNAAEKIALQHLQQQRLASTTQVTAQQTLNLSEGTYIGDVQEGKPQGRGTLTYHPGQKGKKYEGEWKDGKFHGRGALKFSNDASYEGQFENGAAHGQGIHCFSDGAKYEGRFFLGKIHGKGTVRYANGDTYIGDWENGFKTGQGIYTWNNGDVYTGAVKNNKWHGQGTLQCKSGEYYSGGWENGNRQGKGLWISADGRRDEGIFRNNSLWEGTLNDKIVKEGQYVMTGVSSGNLGGATFFVLFGLGCIGTGYFFSTEDSSEKDDSVASAKVGFYIAGGVITGLTVIVGAIYRRSIFCQPKKKDSCWS